MKSLSFFNLSHTHGGQLFTCPGPTIFWPTPFVYANLAGVTHGSESGGPTIFDPEVPEFGF